MTYFAFFFLFAPLGVFGASVGGYIVDIYCWDKPGHIALDRARLQTQPEDHTIHCLVDIQECMCSGYGLLVNVGTPSEPNFQLKYKFDKVGNELTLDFLTNIRPTHHPAQVFVRASGEVDGQVMILSGLEEADISQPFADNDFGYITDILCWERALQGNLALDGANMNTNPEEHTMHCLLDIASCIGSGYGLLGNVGTMEEPDYQLRYRFDAASNNKVLTWLQEIRPTHDAANVFVEVTGTVFGGMMNLEEIKTAIPTLGNHTIEATNCETQPPAVVTVLGTVLVVFALILWYWGGLNRINSCRTGTAKSTETTPDSLANMNVSPTKVPLKLSRTDSARDIDTAASS